MVESLARAKKDNPAKAKTIKPTADTPYTKALDDHGRATDAVAFQFRLLQKVHEQADGKTHQ
jgi:hypothetical protein